MEIAYSKLDLCGKEVLESRVGPREGVRWGVGAPALRVQCGGVGAITYHLCPNALINLHILEP